MSFYFLHYTPCIDHRVSLNSFVFNSDRPGETHERATGQCAQGAEHPAHDEEDGDVALTRTLVQVHHTCNLHSHSQIAVPTIGDN
jgi:hypothetical protein